MTKLRYDRETHRQRSERYGSETLDPDDAIESELKRSRPWRPRPRRKIAPVELRVSAPMIRRKGLIQPLALVGDPPQTPYVEAYQAVEHWERLGKGERRRTKEAMRAFVEECRRKDRRAQAVARGRNAVEHRRLYEKLLKRVEVG